MSVNAFTLFATFLVYFFRKVILEVSLLISWLGMSPTPDESSSAVLVVSEKTPDQEALHMANCCGVFHVPYSSTCLLKSMNIAMSCKIAANLPHSVPIK